MVAEVFPVAQRGKSVIALELFWGFGSVMVAAIALLMIRATSWRYFPIGYFVREIEKVNTIEIGPPFW